MQWTVIVAIKALPGAKSRLLPASRDAQAHRALVQAIRADTVAAAAAARAVGRVLLVADENSALDDFDGTLGIQQHSAGLNGALRDGAEYALTHWPHDGVAALVGDLPALRSSELDDALLDAAGRTYTFVPDAAGTGTTLLTARTDGTIRPAFGTDSAARHVLFAAALAAGQGLRTDVDTADDLAAASELGVGPATAAALRGAASRTCSPEPGIVGA